MEQQYRYFGVQLLDKAKTQMIYMARSEGERTNILKWFENTPERASMRLVDITRSSKMPRHKLGFQSMDFWVARQNQVVSA